jgi:hypothetical protein
MGFETPILFLVFNRPDSTRKVFERIREIKPAQLFVAADGHRFNRPGEKEKCEEVRDLIMNGIDWPCEVKKLFREHNLGCGPAVSGAITWFFDHVEEGIIIEDDILPSHSFFYFTQALLKLYRHEGSVWHIGGNSFNPYKMRSPYYFSSYPHIWGWATWRRAWKNYSFQFDDIDPQKLFANINELFITQSEKKYWINFYEDYFKVEKKTTWDYQWTIRMWYNKGLAILPRENLITNIGFEEDATHTSNKDSWLGHLKANEIEIPGCKEQIKQNKKADLFTSREVFYIKSTGRKILSDIKKVLINPLKKLIKTP